MAEIIKVLKEHLPSLRFIGKRYTEENRVNGGFGHIWDEWFNKAWFEPLAKPGTTEGVENGCIGLMRLNPDFEYWVGAFLPPNTPVSENYEAIDIDEGDIGVCWIKGKADDGSVYDMHGECLEELKANGFGDYKDVAGSGPCFFERYNVPRFTEADEDGNIVLDYCVYLA